MKIYLSKYRSHWLSPYTILEKVYFWREIDYDEPLIDKLSIILSQICVGIQKFLDFVHPRIEYVKIDRYDTWNMDSTLSLIILPMLKQLQETKHGGPLVDDTDVPEELKSTSASPKENEWDTDDNHFKRWDYVLSEMIFAFQKLNDDSWENEFSSGNFDMKNVPCKWDENGKVTLYSFEHGPNHTFKTDYDAIKVINDRIANGLQLFGKYYRGLWD